MFAFHQETWFKSELGTSITHSFFTVLCLLKPYFGVYDLCFVSVDNIGCGYNKHYTSHFLGKNRDWEIFIMNYFVSGKKVPVFGKGTGEEAGDRLV